MERFATPTKSPAQICDDSACTSYVGVDISHLQNELGEQCVYVPILKTFKNHQNCPKCSSLFPNRAGDSFLSSIEWYIIWKPVFCYVYQQIILFQFSSVPSQRP